MIQLNITLLVQMLNFLVTWKFLDTFFLKKCVKEVEKEQCKQAELEQAVAMELVLVERMEQLQLEAQKEIQQQFRQSVPPVLKEIPFRDPVVDTFLISRECNVTACQQIQTETVDFLVKRITRV